MLLLVQTTSTRASGQFDVTMNPQAPYDTSDGVSLARASIIKQFHGDLDASSTVEMLSAGTPIEGSAGYVAIERITGSLHGKGGSFVLQHSGTMTRGRPDSIISVIPDSGTGELLGIVGKMTIEIVDGKHLYTFDYTFETPG
jgi:hypothetical protein